MAGLVVVGVVLRVVVAGQSLFADELSSYWVVSGRGVGGVVSTVHTDAEITPPLFFVLAWLATRIDVSAELLRLPSLLAGVASIPLTYLLGLRTVGRGAGLVACALAALSPFMIFYAAEARGYALAVVLVLGSTLALLAAVERAGARWWVVYGVCSCAAVYTHYTTVFALGAQLVWVCWAHPRARRAVLLVNAAAALAFLPWLSGVIADFESPTTDIVDLLDALTLESARVTLEHWAVGYPLVIPNTALRELPGVLGLVLLALGVGAAVLGLGRRWARERPWPTQLDRRLVLVLAIALGGPAGLALWSIVGTNLIAVRHLAACWPAFAVVVAALLMAAGRRLRFVAAGLVIASFALGAVGMLGSDFQRPDYEGAAAFIERRAAPGDVVIDITHMSPAPVTAMEVALDRANRVFPVGRLRVQYDPFKVLAGPVPAADVTGRAVEAAAGGRVFIVSSETVFARGAPTDVPFLDEVIAALPPGYRHVETRTSPGILSLAVLVYARG